MSEQTVGAQASVGDRSADRLVGLRQAVDAASGRLLERDIAEARSVVDHAAERLRLSGEHTIVALAGATGSGKSTLFNALTDLELAGTGVRRPTTSWALACSWGPEGAEDVLEWMGIPARHQVSRMGMLDRSTDDQKLDGLILLDLPDHDSTEVAHHLEMDRLVQLADLVVWVLDPQKYADAAIHDRYIRPMAGHREVTLVVLNQVDRIPYEDRARAMEDVRRLISEAGLKDVPVVGVSARRGDGVPDLKRELARRIRAKKAARERLMSDLDGVVDELVEVAGISQGPGIGPVDEEALEVAVMDAAGGPQFVDAVETASRRQASRLMGWPVLRLLLQWRTTDPLEDMDLGISRSDLADNSPAASGSQSSQVEAAVRELADRATVGLLPPWRHAVRNAALRGTPQLIAEIDQTMLDLGRRNSADRLPWRLGAVAQWALLAVGLAGLLWLFGLGVAGVVTTVGAPPQVLGVSIPLLLAAVGLIGGIVFDVVARLVVASTAKVRARRADRILSGEVSRATHELVIEPARAELAQYESFRAGVLQARG